MKQAEGAVDAAEDRFDGAERALDEAREQRGRSVAFVVCQTPRAGLPRTWGLNLRVMVRNTCGYLTGSGSGASRLSAGGPG